MKMLSFLSIFIFAISAFAMNGRTTYQAKIVKPDGYPLEASSVNFKFTVLDPAASCVIYTETYSAINMTSTGGLISFALGSGIRGFPAASATTAVFENVFDNSITSIPCQPTGIYNPLPTHNRSIVMQFNDGNGWQTLPAMPINAVPYAMYAAKSVDSKTLNGKADTDFVENSTLAALNCNPATHAITFNGASFSCIAVGSGGGGITSVTTSGSVLSTGGTASAPVISIQAATMSQDGYLTSLDYAEFKAKLSASSTEIINTLGYTPVSSSTVASQIASSTLAGDVSGNPGSNTVNSVGGKTASQISTSVDETLAATSSSTADTIVKRNSLGNATFNDLYASSAKINYVDIYKPSTSFNIRLQAPTSLSTNYVLNLPTTSGTVGQVLSTDGSGNLSWISPTTGSVVSVSATAPLASTGGSNPTISITQATSSTDGYLSSSDWVTFNNKQQATSAAIIATLGYIPADNAASGTYAQKANNLSDLTNIPQARTNLGLGTFATASTIDLGSASATGTLDIARLPSFVGDATVQAASNTIVLSNSGVVAGTYTKVTVDAKGRVTSSSSLSSSDVTTALGYTPATSTTLAASFVQKTGDTMTGLLNLPSNGLAVGSNQLIVSGSNVGIGVLNPESALHLKAGTVSNAPLKFTSGTLLSAAQSGTIEYDGSQLYFTDGSSIRRALATNSAAGSFDNTSSISNTSGNITLSPNNVTGSVIVNSSAASISSGTGALVVNGGVGVGGSINAAGNLNLAGSATIAQNLTLSSMTSGSLLFAGASGVVSENNSKLFWDGANQRLGVGTNSPAQALSVSGASYFSGNVGIGTENPIFSKLQIGTTDAGKAAIYARTDATSGTNYGIDAEALGVGGVSNIASYFAASGAATNIAVLIPNGYPLPGNDNFAIKSESTAKSYFAGNVGIGTTNPSTKVDITGSDATSYSASMSITPNGSDLLRIVNPDNTADGYAGIMLQHRASNISTARITIQGGFFSPGESALTFGLRGPTGTNTIERMRIVDNGNVGIGTTSPSYTLDVSGTLRVTGQAYTNTGNGSFSILSDVRYKDVHGSYDRGLAEVLNIDIIKFNYKKDNPLGSDSSHEYVGVSAQNLQQVIPEAVEPRKDGDKEYLTINTSPVLWTLINAVKQLYSLAMGEKDHNAYQDRQIASIVESKADKAETDTKIKVLEQKAAKVDKLEAENTALKSYLCSKDPAAPICK